MNEHPIEGLMITAMNSIQDMIDVNTIIGEPIETSNNVVVIPISKVSFGFAAGGSEFKGETIDEYSKRDKEEEIQYRLPFGGGSGAGVSINPIAFLVIQPEGVRLLPVNYTSAIDKLLDYVPDLMDKVNCVVNKMLKDPNKIAETTYQTSKMKPEKRKEATPVPTPEPEEKNIKQRPKRTRTSQVKPQPPVTTSMEYEYDETVQDNLGEMPDYTNYSDEYDD